MIHPTNRPGNKCLLINFAIAPRGYRLPTNYPGGVATAADIAALNQALAYLNQDALGAALEAQIADNPNLAITFLHAISPA